MRGVAVVHQRLLRTAHCFGKLGASIGGEKPVDQPAGRIVIVGHRPVTRDHGPSPGADECAHQPVERKAAPCDTGLEARAERGCSRRIASRQDYQIGIYLQIEDLGKRQQPIGLRVS